MKDHRNPRLVAVSKSDGGTLSLPAQLRKRRTALKVDEVAELLAVTSKHIYKMAHEGRIPSIRIGGAVRFDPHVTAQWLEDASIAAVNTPA
jgi:excisionase family DNA binding protein